MQFSFCPRCGIGLKKQSRNLLVCMACGYNFYLNPKPVANLILENEKGEILLAKRKFPPNEGMWNLPGGFLEINETLEQGLAREIQEELHIILHQPRYFNSYVERYLSQEINHYIVNIIFVNKQRDPQIIVGDDTSEAVFFAPSDIPYKKMSAPSEIQAIKEYLIATGK